MTYAGTSFMAEFRQVRPRERLSAFLRSVYGHGGENRDKRLARDLGVSDRAARNLFLGHWPNDVTMAAIVRRFGNDVWRAVLAPEIEPVIAELDLEQRQLEEALAAVEKRRRQVAGRPEGDPQRATSIEARSLGEG